MSALEDVQPLAPQECGHKLCHEQATEAITVFNPWARCIFKGDNLERRREFALCRSHFDKYFPRGLGYMLRKDSVALHIQCREATS